MSLLEAAVSSHRWQLAAHILVFGLLKRVTLQEKALPPRNKERRPAAARNNDYRKKQA